MATENPKSQKNQVSSVVTIPGYKITGILGRGGMAIVYKAIQESIGRTVAIKVLAPNHTDETFTDRFLREAQIISDLTHPNIITVFDAGVHKSHHYMSMEYISGKTLRDLRDEFTRKQKVDVVKQIANALDYAGKKGYVHRDIKPENIMLHEDGRAVLMDFGIARGDDSARGLTLTGKAIGTPYYMSPEQTKGLKVDYRSDIYSLGVVLFQALTGVVPYDGNSFVDIGMKHIVEPIPKLPNGLELFQPIINTAMSKDPAHRYQSAVELIVALNKISISELDKIDAKAAVISNKATNYNDDTLIASEINQPIQTPIESNKHKSELKQNIKAGLKVRSKTQYQNKGAAPKVDINALERSKSVRRRRRLLYLLLLISVVFGVYYNQKTLKPYWQQYAVPVLQEYLPADFMKKIGLEQIVSITVPKESGEKNKQVPLIKPKETFFSEKDFIGGAIIENEKKLSVEEIAVLFNNIKNDPEHINEIINYYKGQLSENYKDRVTRNGIIKLRTWFLTELKNSMEENDIIRGKQLLNALKNNFPKIVKRIKYQQFENELLKKEAITTHLQLAKVYFSKKHYIEPISENVLNEINFVLDVEPNNTQAKALKTRILDIFVEQVKSYQSTRHYESAIISAESGLKISKNDAFLKSSYKNLQKLLNVQQQVDSKMRLAESQMLKGNYVTPANNNAFKHYSSVFSLDTNNRIAKQALKEIELKLVTQATQAIKSNNISNAKLILQLLEQYYPDSEYIKKTQTKLAEAIDSKEPLVAKIVFSDVLMSSMEKMEDIRIQSGKLIYVGIKYANFSERSTYLLVNLLDQTAVTKISKKTIKIDGATGEQIFTIEIPGEGLAIGNYYVELKLGKKSLIKKSFQIFNP